MKQPEPPQSLLQLQSWFHTIETRPIEKLSKDEIPIYPEGLKKEIQEQVKDGPYLKSFQKIGVYNQQYWYRFLNVMQAHYPGLVRLFGTAQFNQRLAIPYLIENPSHEFWLYTLGYRFPNWLETHYQEEDRSLCLEMAQIDFAFQSIRYAKEKPQPKQLNGKLFLQSFVALFQLKTDLFAFREKLLSQPVDYWENNPFPDLLPAKRPLYFLLFRKKTEIFLGAITKVEFDLLQAFKEGATLEGALSKLSEEVSEEDLSLWFQTWAQNRLFQDACKVSSVHFRS